MHTSSAILLYLCIVITFLQNMIFFTIVAVLLFSVRYGAVSLIPLALLIDGYFGNFYQLPLLSMSAIVWYMLIEYIRPRLIHTPHLRI